MSRTPRVVNGWVVAGPAPNLPLDVELTVDGMPVAQEVLVDPEVGLHLRPLR